MVQVIPDYANPCEYGYYLALNLEESFNAMMQEIGIRELHSLEENGAVVLEDGESAASTEKKTNAVKKFLEDAYDKIKELYGKAADFIKNHLIDPAKKKINSIIGSESKAHNAIKDKLSKIKSTTKDGKDKTFGKTFDWGNFDDTKYMEIADKYAKVVINDEELAKINNAVEAAFHVKGGAKGSDVKKAIDKEMRGDKEIDVTMSYIKNNFEEIWSWATSFDVSGKKLGKSLKAAKKSFDKAGSEFKKSVAFKDRDDAFKATTKSVKEMSTLLGHISSAVCNNIRTRTTHSIKIVLRLCIAAKQKEEAEKKAVGESSYIPGSFQTELASLFNF